MCSKRRILLKNKETSVSSGIKAICILHNSVIQHESDELTEFTENEMTGPGDENCGQSQYRFSEIAKIVRETFLKFFNGIGRVPWQNDYVL
jgi:hypothetical protein